MLVRSQETVRQICFLDLISTDISDECTSLGTYVGASNHVMGLRSHCVKHRMQRSVGHFEHHWYSPEIVYSQVRGMAILSLQLLRQCCHLVREAGRKGRKECRRLLSIET